MSPITVGIYLWSKFLSFVMSVLCKSGDIVSFKSRPIFTTTVLFMSGLCVLQVALNLVQLWENATSVGPNGHNGFTVSVRDRNYQ